MINIMEIDKITYVIPCYNESEAVREFYRRISFVATNLQRYSFEFVFVNDGSSDDTRYIRTYPGRTKSTT